MSADKDTIELPRDVVLAWRNQWGYRKCDVPVNRLLQVAIEDALWKPPVATIPWVSVEDHPHPIHVPMIVRYRYGGIEARDDVSIRGVGDITHWCLLPEADR